MAQEHTPNRYLVAVMTGFFRAMALAALMFWLGGVVWPGGLPGLITALGPGATAAFIAFHIPAAITGILLWQWTRATMSPRIRVLHEGATLYFSLAVIFGIFLNYLVVSAMQDVLGPALRGGSG